VVGFTSVSSQPYDGDQSDTNFTTLRKCVKSYIMRVFLNEQRVKRNRRIATYLFFVSIVILLGGLVVSYTVTATNPELMIIPLIAMPVGLVTTWFSVRLTNQYVRKPYAEDVLQAAFKGVSAHSVAYHYLFQANHVLVCEQGVYAFVARFQEGIFRVTGDKIINPRARGPLGGFMTLMRQEQLGNPILDAQVAAAQLQVVLDEALQEAGVMQEFNITVQPVVVFTAEKADLDIREEPPIPVVLAIPKKDKPSLKGLLKEDRKQSEVLLNAPQVSAIEEAFNTRLMIQTALPAETADDLA